MTHKEIEQALDQPGFALANLPKAEQRLLVDTVYGLLADKTAAVTALAVPSGIREKFEAFAREMDWDLSQHYGNYSDCNVDHAWIGYMAAIRAQLAP